MSDYLLVSSTDDPAGDGESLKIEKISDPAVVFDVGELASSVAVPGVISIPMMPAGSQVSSYGGFLYG